MKLVGFVGSDFNVDQLTALGANVQHRGSFVANLIVRPYNAYIQFDSYDENRYRPYLQLDAELIGGRGSFGNDVTEFGYRENDYLNRSVRYDFTDHELALLVEKGLYQPDFEVPEIFTDTDFEIPIDTYQLAGDGAKEPETEVTGELKATRTYLYAGVSNNYTEPSSDYLHNLKFVSSGNMVIPIPLSTSPELATTIQDEYTGGDLYTPYLNTQLHVANSTFDDVGNSPGYRIVFMCKIYN